MVIEGVATTDPRVSVAKTIDLSSPIPRPLNYTLEIKNLTAADAGVYECGIPDWEANPLTKFELVIQDD